MGIARPLQILKHLFQALLDLCRVPLDLARCPLLACPGHDPRFPAVPAGKLALEIITGPPEDSWNRNGSPCVLIITAFGVGRPRAACHGRKPSLQTFTYYHFDLVEAHDSKESASAMRSTNTPAPRHTRNIQFINNSRCLLHSKTHPCPPTHSPLFWIPHASDAAPQAV